MELPPILLDKFEKDMRFILARHGETEENLRDELQGQLPGVLTELGWQQARDLAKAMQEFEFDVVVSSDLARSYNTAKCVADLKGMEVEPTPLLREMDWGIYTGQALKEVSWYNLPESVESIQALYDRAKAFVDYLREKYQGKRVFAVGHGAVNRAIETVITGAEPISMVELPIMTNTSWKIFEI